MTLPKNEKDQNENKGFSLLGLAIAAAMATAVGLMFMPKKGEEIEKEVKEKAEKIAKKFKKTRSDIQTIVKDIFGEVTDDLEKAYIQIRSYVMAMIEDAKKQEKFTKEDYQNIVKEAVKEFSKGQKWTQDHIDKLTETLKDEWKELSR